VFVLFGTIELADQHPPTSAILPRQNVVGGGRWPVGPSDITSMRVGAAKRQKYFSFPLFLRLLFAIFNVNHV
jgi:hypothetical protein